jgi:hypothetical protein
LAYLSEQIKGDKAIDDITAAAYINKWNSSILAGTATFEHDLNRARRRNPQPTVFAIMDVASNFIQLAHGIEEVVLDDADDHDADGQIGFFLGDRVNVKVAGMIQQHDPTFVLIPTLDDLTAQFHGRPAKSNECAKTNHKGLLPVDPKARMVDVPKIHPIPPLWWGWFLQRDRTPTQTYQWAAAVMRRWKTGTEKIAADSLKRWLRAACTESLEVARSSAIHVNLLPSGRDNLVLEWASNSLHQYLPRPKQTPPTPSPTQQRDTTRTPSRYTDADTVRDAMRLAHAVVQSSADRPSREPTKDKTMPETTLCRLLGLSSLTWADREHLAPIWQKLHQQPDRHAKGMVLRAFFQQLGKQDPAFRRFRNNTLYESITTYKFEPGASYETAHHGISLLAVSMRSFAAQERERLDEANFERATAKTPEAVRKHTEKGPPPIPTTIAELLELIVSFIVLTKGLFTDRCSLVIQLEDLRETLRERQQKLLGDPTAAKELIPQLVWAIICASQEFFETVSTREDVDPPEDGYGPSFAQAELSIHTSMFKAGYKLQLADIPEQWMSKSPPTPTEHPRSNQRNPQANTDSERRRGGNPFRPNGPGEAAAGVHPNPPRALQTADFKTIKETIPHLLLSDVTLEAGLNGGPSSLNRGTWPNNLCLNWAIMGACQRSGCRFQHPKSLDNTSAATVYQQLEPGIKRLMETKKKPERK